MPSASPQTFANHTRFDPLYHYILVPLTLAVLYCVGMLVYRHHDLLSFTLLGLSLAFFIVVAKVRTYSLLVQDRVIRLEERLRLMTILPPLIHHRIAELSERQLIALRFASDQELMALTARVLEEKLEPKQIKAAIVDWRPDTFRV
jgi:uncharacterized membrane protein